MKRAFLPLAAAIFAAALPAGTALAEDHEVLMLNRGADGQTMVFEPAYLEVAVGDTVTFVATDRAHNAETIPGMVPEGGETFRGRMNEDVSVTFTADGVYGVKCLPHYGLGMVALIKVGDDVPVNLEEAAAVRQPGRARQRMQALFDQMQQVGGAEQPVGE